MSPNNVHPTRLYVIDVGHALQPNMPFACFLIEMSDGTRVLVDSGLPDVLPTADQMPPGFIVVPGETVVMQLARIGLQPDDIDLLVCTHFDFDHCGQNIAFQTSKYVVQQEHFDVLPTDRRYDKTRAQWDQPLERYQFVDGDVELLPGVELLKTSGHATGHQSVLIRLPHTGPVLLTIDAVGQRDRFARAYEGRSVDTDKAASVASTHKLLDLVEREHVQLVIFGHDVEQQAHLRYLPEFYD